MTNNVRKTFGFILTVIVAIVAGYYIAWNQTSIMGFIASIGGIGNLVVALAGLIALVLAVFWPKKWHEWLRKLLFIAIILVLIFGAGRVFGDAFAQAPWLTILGLIGVVIVVVVLYSITVLDRPLISWLARAARKRP